MEITPGIGPEDLDPRKVQRLLYVAIGCVVLAGFMAWLSARASAAASASAEYAGIESNAATRMAEAARTHAIEAEMAEQRAARIPALTTTTEAPNAEVTAGDHGPEAQDQAAGAGAAGIA